MVEVFSSSIGGLKGIEGVSRHDVDKEYLNKRERSRVNMRVGHSRKLFKSLRRRRFVFKKSIQNRV